MPRSRNTRARRACQHMHACRNRPVSSLCGRAITSVAGVHLDEFRPDFRHIYRAAKLDVQPCDQTPRPVAPHPAASGPIVLLLSCLSLSSYPFAWMQGCHPPQVFASARLSVNAFTLYSDLALTTVGFRNSLRRRRWFPSHRRPFRGFPV